MPFLTRRQHFTLVWGAFLVLPPIMIAFAVLITLSLMSSGDMGREEWVFISAYVCGVAVFWALRLWLNRFQRLRRWMDLD